MSIAQGDRLIGRGLPTLDHPGGYRALVRHPVIFSWRGARVVICSRIPPKNRLRQRSRIVRRHDSFLS